MGANTEPAYAYNGRLMEQDMAARGWNRKALAKRARTTAMSVGRFIAGESQTPTMAAKLAKALGQSVDRYLIRLESEAV